MNIINGNKAQISAQIFIYILAAVLAGIILLVGYKAISTIISTMGQVNIDSFKSEFTNKVNSVSRGMAISKYEFSLSNDFQEICFVDSMNDQNKFEFDSNKITNALIKSSVDNNAKMNVFLLFNNKIEKNFYVDKLDVRDDYLCLQNQGQMVVWLKGIGKKAELYTQ